jgi:hypothetical protein
MAITKARPSSRRGALEMLTRVLYPILLLCAFVATVMAQETTPPPSPISVRMSFDFKNSTFTPFAGYKVRTLEDIVLVGDVDVWVQVGQVETTTVFSGVFSKGFALNKSRTITLDIGINVDVVPDRPIRIGPSLVLSLVRF